MNYHYLIEKCLEESSSINSSSSLDSSNSSDTPLSSVETPSSSSQASSSISSSSISSKLNNLPEGVKLKLIQLIKTISKKGKGNLIAFVF